MKMHFNKAIESEDVFYQRRKLLFTNEQFDAIYSLDLDDFLNRYDDPFLSGLGNYSNVGVIGDDSDGYVMATTLKLPGISVSNYFSQNWSLESFCYGLVLFKLDSKLYVANPAIREYKKLPAPWEELGPEPSSSSGLGFGFDHSTDDFIVVKWWSLKDGIKFSVYALKTGSWRPIQGRFPYTTGSAFGGTGILLNGGLHWLMKRLEDKSRVIVSLLLADNEVREIPLPPDLTDVGDWDYLPLGLFFKESLCIARTVVEFVDETTATSNNHFWVMKEYGVGESWTKRKFSYGFAFSLLPSGYWRENHVLFYSRVSQELGMYNFNDLSCRDVWIPGFPIVTGAGFYVESLVSLD